MNSVFDTAIGTFIGGLVLLALLTAPKLPIFAKKLRSKYHVYRFFQEKKTGVLEGFGIMIDGLPVMDKKQPLLFERYIDAKVEITNRGLRQENGLVKKPKKAVVNWQRWDLDNLELVCCPVLIGGANGSN